VTENSATGAPETRVPGDACRWQGRGQQQTDVCGYGSSGPYAAEVSYFIDMAMRLARIRTVRGIIKWLVMVTMISVICSRSMVASFFTPEHINSMRPQIQNTVDFFLKEMIKAGCEKPVDLVEKFSLLIPSRVSLSSSNYQPSRQTDVSDNR
jgi:hypothetical protein